MRILLPGPIDSRKPQDGYVLLRGLVVMFIVILCFAAVLTGMTVFTHRSALLFRDAQEEIQYRNREIIKMADR